MKREPIITRRRNADANNDVITVERGGGSYRRTVCADCPWRKDAVGVFPAEAFRLSAHCGTDGARMSEVGFSDAGSTFGCHTNGAEKPATCAGYILQSYDAIGWRIAVATGKFDPKQVSDGGVELHENYYEMAVANGVPADDPALDGRRPWRGRDDG